MCAERGRGLLAKKKSSLKVQCLGFLGAFLDLEHFNAM